MGSIYDERPTGYHDSYQKQIDEIYKEKDYAYENFGGDFRTYGEEDLFTKITDGILKATQRDTYQPFFEMQRGGAEGSLLAGINKVGTTGFTGSGREQSILDALQGQYAQSAIGFQQQAFSQQQQAQQSLDDIIRSNKEQSFQLRQMELA